MTPRTEVPEPSAPSAQTSVRPVAPVEAAGPRSRFDSLPGAVVLGVVACAAIAAVILHPYVTNDFRQPLGWDSMFYVWRTRALPVDGLDRVGAIRAGFPLLAAMLSQATGQSALTIVAVLPAVLAGIAALGAAALARAGVGIASAWIPVVGFLTWAAFGPNEIPLHHFDNLLNAALILAAFAVSLRVAEGERGATAVAVLLAGAGLAHWPFFAVAMVVLVSAVLASWWLRRRRSEDLGTATPEARLLAAAGVAGAFTGLTLLARPDTGWLGAQPGNLSSILRERVQTRLGEPLRFVAVPLAAAGALVVWGRGDRSRSARPHARRLLGLLVAAWTVLTLGAVLAQLAGFPAAGARVLSYFFPVTLLTGLLIWWGGRQLWRRSGAGARALAAVAVIAVVAGFGTLFVNAWSDRHPWVEERAVRQAATAGVYVAQEAPASEVVYLLDMRRPRDLATLGRWWLVIKASLPPDQVARAHRYVGTPEDFMAGRPSLALGEGLPPGETDRPDPALAPGNARSSLVAIALERYNSRAFERLSAGRPADVVGPGVLVLQGPAPARPVRGAAAAAADTSGRNLVLVWGLCLAIAFLAGLGWARALLAPDGTLQALVAPALGLAASTLAAFAWALGGLSLDGWWAVGPLAVAAAAGWAAAAGTRASLHLQASPGGSSTGPAA